MTNKEMMQASLLDIIFEHRNKDYGAYALRKHYDKRLLTALLAGLATVSIIILFMLFGNKKEERSTIIESKGAIVIKEYKLPEPDKKKPELQKPVVKQVKQKPAVKTAQVKLTSTFDIKKDDLVKTSIPSQTDMTDKKIGDDNIKGKPDDGTLKAPVTDNPGTGPATSVTPETNAVFVPQERDPEFPGGPGALQRFLAKHLQTPEELEAGERKLVKIKFKVDKDGSVNSFEIVTSAGAEFDNEVVRVCKKMPAWTPALQNGVNVPVTYMIPVTFMGSE